MIGDDMKTYEISSEVVQSLINYLGTKPYNEVRMIVPILQNLKVVENGETKE